jgi:hypothetical protein
MVVGDLRACELDAEQVTGDISPERPDETAALVDVQVPAGIGVHSEVDASVCLGRI